MITFEQIAKANEGLTTVDIRGKDYVQVAQRVKAFRMLYPQGFIKTDIVSLADGACVMRAWAGYYTDDGKEVVLGTGTALEREESSFINRTSHAENAETSAIGRCLGFLGLGIDAGGICSAEELLNAVRNQETPVRALPKNTEPKLEKTADLTEIRAKLDIAIKAATKDMTKEQKIRFINETVQPTLKGERNWKLCENPALLSALLAAIEKNAA